MQTFEWICNKVGLTFEFEKVGRIDRNFSETTRTRLIESGLCPARYSCSNR